MMNTQTLQTTISTNISTNNNSEKDIFIRKLHEQCIILKNKNVALEERIEWMEDELKETRGYTLYLYFENGDSEEHRYHIWERKKMISKLNYHYNDPFYHGVAKPVSYVILQNGKITNKG